MRNLTLCEEKEAANGSAAAGLRTAVDADADATHCLDKRARRREATIPSPVGSKYRVEEHGAIERRSADEVSGRNSEVGRELPGDGGFMRRYRNTHGTSTSMPAVCRGVYVFWCWRIYGVGLSRKKKGLWP